MKAEPVHSGPALNTSFGGNDDQVGSVGFFRSLFSGERFQFELGLRRALPDWFVLNDGLGDEVLLDRSQWLESEGSWPDGVVWSPSADALLQELMERCFQSPAGIEPAVAPSEVARSLSRRWKPDFLLLSRDARDGFRFVGGSVCFPSGWAPEEKLGLGLESIHDPVPGLNGHLASRINTFLDRLRPGTSFERFNWGVAAVPDRNHHPRRGLPRLTRGYPLSKAWLRLEHQSFHALPRTGGVVFLIDLSVHSAGPILADRETSLNFANQLRTMPHEVAVYKGLDAVRDQWIESLEG
jgi:Protein of unknown function (DUF3445)